MLIGLTIGCTNSIKKLAEARQLAAELHARFNKAADASNRAVMADADEASIAFAREANLAKQAVDRDAQALAPVLRELRLTEEAKLLDEVVRHFSEYQNLDRSILALAIENTNLKAQRLSFGAAREAAESFSKSLRALVLITSPKSRAQVESLALHAALAVRELQVLHGPHIAESSDPQMTRMEKEMAALEVAARAALTSLSKLIEPGARDKLAQAFAHLDRFKDLHTQLIALSRRNSNVRSLEMARGQGLALAAACDASMSALSEALERQKSTNATR